MRVSFDIDETLTGSPTALQSESGCLPSSVVNLFGEPLRPGTRSLTKSLRKSGTEIWIYTTSVRTPFYIRRWFLMFGLRLDGVVNDLRHRNAMAKITKQRPPSKYPPAFAIDLHIDDSPGVELEGKQNGFEVLLVSPNDSAWATRVKDAVAAKASSIKSKRSQ